MPMLSSRPLSWAAVLCSDQPEALSFACGPEAPAAQWSGISAQAVGVFAVAADGGLGRRAQLSAPRLAPSHASREMDVQRQQPGLRLPEEAGRSSLLSSPVCAFSCQGEACRASAGLECCVTCPHGHRSCATCDLRPAHVCTDQTRYRGAQVKSKVVSRAQSAASSWTSCSCASVLVALVLSSCPAVLRSRSGAQPHSTSTQASHSSGLVTL